MHGMTVVGGRRSEYGGRRARAVVGGRRAECGGRRTVVGGRRAEDGGRRSEVVLKVPLPIIGQTGEVADSTGEPGESPELQEQPCA
jgi:hypothetical protein